MPRATVSQPVSKLPPNPEPSDYDTPFEWNPDWNLPKSQQHCCIDEEWECIVDLLHDAWIEQKKEDVLTIDTIVDTLVPTLFEKDLSTWEEYRNEALTLLDL